MNLIRRIENLYIHYLSRLVLFSIRHKRLVISSSIVFAVFSLVMSFFYLPINAEQEKLVSRESTFLQKQDILAAAFPQHRNTIIVVLEGEDPWTLSQKTQALAEQLRVRKDLFHDVLYPQGEDFFRQNGLLYLDEPQLEKFIESLAEAQPAIATLSQDPSLRGLWRLLEDGIGSKQGGKSGRESLNHIIRELNKALLAFEQKRPIHNVWGEAFPNWTPSQKLVDSNKVLQMIVLNPVLNFSKLNPADDALEHLRRLEKTLALKQAGIEMSLTGREPLTADELDSVIVNIEIAAAISTLAIIILLGAGIRSWRLIAIIMGVLFTGMSWTLGWAALSIGELNFISSAFAILFIGLCVDFSIHVALRYREEYRKTKNIEDAMTKTAEGAGSAVSLCALATAIGFLSFVPTEFTGLRDLGIIAGGSMFLALLASWTLLPALLCLLTDRDLLRAAATKPNILLRFSTKVYNRVEQRFRTISITAIVLGALAVPFALQMKFDYSALSIKDQSVESIVALKKLLNHGLFTDYTGTLLVESRKEAIEVSKQFEKLPSVYRVENHLAFVPKNQETKLELIEEARFLLGPALNSGEARAARNSDLTRATRNFLKALNAKNKKNGLTTEERTLAQNLSALLRTNPQSLPALNQALMGDYPEQLAQLSLSLQATRFVFDDLPQHIKRESQTTDGNIKISIYPKEDLIDPAALTRFVKSLEAIHPEVGGRPAVEYEIGALISRSFQQALLIAFAMISLLLLLALKSVAKVLLVLVPIALTAFWTLAFCVWADIAFNFVNILTLPLLLGLGVANGIHILSRAEKQPSLNEVMTSSTPVAIFLSNATTLASFGSMSVATHWGLQSMGIMLSVAMILMMVSALIVLPAIIRWWKN